MALDAPKEGVMNEILESFVQGAGGWAVVIFISIAYPILMLHARRERRRRARRGVRGF